MMMMMMRLVEAAVEFGNQKVNQFKVANLALCLDVLKVMRCCSIYWLLQFLGRSSDC